MRTTPSSSLSPKNPDEIRVVSTTTTGFVDPRVDESVIWQGQDTDKLSLEFPPSDIWGADPLGHKEIEDGWIRWDHRFERQLEDGTWEEIDDPRRRLTPMTDLEREIDTENRRLFPGDYETDDDCGRCGGYGCDECEDPYGYDEQDEYDEYEDDVPDEPDYDCESCHDYGCTDCEPEKYCCDCRDYLLPREGPLCKRCQDYHEQYADHPCRQCGAVSVDYDLDICHECEHQLYLQQIEADEAYGITHCYYCEKELSDGENWICSGCECEMDAENAVYKEWWIDPNAGRLKRSVSWTRWMLYRIRRIKR